MNIYVSNLAFQVKDQDLKTLFAPFGEVSLVNVVMDRTTGQSRGFAFVEMTDSAGEEAIKALNGTELEGRALSVSVARPKPTKPRREGLLSEGNNGRY
jgi:RNA recognition motif-containing protein